MMTGGKGAEPAVLVVDVSNRGGIATYTGHLCDALRAVGAHVGRAGPPGVGDPGLELHALRWGPDVARMSRLGVYRMRLGEIVPAASALNGAVARWRPDIVHVQTEVVPGVDHLALRMVSRHVPVVLTVHDPVPLEGGARYAADQACRRRAADALIVHDEQSRWFVESSAPGVPVFVVPVDLPLGTRIATRAEARSRLGLKDAPSALLLGQLRPYKDVGVLADAWPGVIAAVPDARLLVVGEPYDSTDLRRLQELPGVETWPDFVPEGDLDLWAAAADVLVLPYHIGSHSGVLHRGLASGTPVLASPALAEEVHRTAAGRVVPLDATAWAERAHRGVGRPPPRRSRPSGGRGHRRRIGGGLPPGDPDPRRAMRTSHRWILSAVLTTAASSGHVIYPGWLAYKTRNRPAPAAPPEPSRWPAVTVVIPAYKEAGVIAAKVTDVKANGYPGPLEVLVVCDGDEDTQRCAKEAGAITVTAAERLGKAQAINLGFAQATTPVVVLSDANNTLAPGALAAMVRHFEDPEVGAVAGEKVEREPGAESHQGLYWHFESWLKQREWQLGSTVGLVGELAAVRRSAWRPIPQDIASDDLWTALDVCEQGYRIAYEPDAKAYEPPARMLRQEWERRTRIASGALHVFGRRRRQLGPSAGVVAVEIWGHRVVRYTVAPVAHAALIAVAARRVRKSRLARIFLFVHVIAGGGPVAPGD